MGRYAQARKRGSDRHDRPPAALPSVPLTVVADSFLDWSGYAGPTPFYWAIEVDGDVNLADPADGETFGPLDAGSSCRVQGQNADNSASTQWSNTVIV